MQTTSGYEGLVRPEPAIHDRDGAARIENVPQVVAHLPWGHIRTILDKAATAEERAWYAAAIQYGWSRNVLINMMMIRSMEGDADVGGHFVQIDVADHRSLGFSGESAPLQVLVGPRLVVSGIFVHGVEHPNRCRPA
ncbi:DUF1016 N-terminal domain-containing protein [Arthrobacter sp. NPDC093128]|uniref:DUF1016 N-terminal domain-containing protein n=1 Tax=Arthrobacter sp. NPDC093128 TaxID=3154979 RepID=UPI003429184E